MVLNIIFLTIRVDLKPLLFQVQVLQIPQRFIYGALVAVAVAGIVVAVAADAHLVICQLQLELILSMLAVAAEMEIIALQVNPVLLDHLQILTEEAVETVEEPVAVDVLDLAVAVEH